MEEARANEGQRGVDLAPGEDQGGSQTCEKCGVFTDPRYFPPYPCSISALVLCCPDGRIRLLDRSLQGPDQPRAQDGACYAVDANSTFTE